MNLVVHSRDYPILDVTVQHTQPVRLRFQGDSFDELPPLVTILHPDGTAHRGPFPPGGVFNAGPHSKHGGPFVCMRGSRDYHTHHLEDAWSNYRGQDGMGIVGILMQLASVWRKGT
ncbi:hypothetical protein GGD63_007257 [Bradyrhizobium sp. cir1]|uniref:hypothetical protein n=1 Tax=Bradyrhizobium sp. cir1 TaxID=1445730 RepID=UPI001606B12D|nr:hypothetical protein [Bradyrhizobium sp. cir1]MBB4374427.1 hypothetical protein [Bradyrhizobium sp. cir1]